MSFSSLYHFIQLEFFLALLILSAADLQVLPEFTTATQQTLNLTCLAFLARWTGAFGTPLREHPLFAQGSLPPPRRTLMPLFPGGLLALALVLRLGARIQKFLSLDDHQQPALPLRSFCFSGFPPHHT